MIVQNMTKEKVVIIVTLFFWDNSVKVWRSEVELGLFSSLHELH